MQKVQTSSSTSHACLSHTKEKEKMIIIVKLFFSGSGCEYCAVFLPLEKAIKTFSLSPPVSFTYLKGNRCLPVPPPWFMERENTSSVRSNDGKVFFFATKRSMRPVLTFFAWVSESSEIYCRYFFVDSIVRFGKKKDAWNDNIWYETGKELKKSLWCRLNLVVKKQNSFRIYFRIFLKSN